MRLTNREIMLAGITALLLAAILPVLLTVSGVFGSTFSLSSDCTATTGAIISASKFNTCLTGVQTGINAIDNDRVATGAGIVGSKLDLTSGTGRIQMSPAAFSGVPSTTGSVFNSAAVTFTDSDTAASGTAASFAAYAIQRPTLAAGNTSVTTTNAATLYIPNSPAAGTNQTITNAYAIQVVAGNVLFGGAFTLTGAATFNGAVTLGDAAGDAITVTGTLASNLIFTDDTYDVGAIGATRPRHSYWSGDVTSRTLRGHIYGLTLSNGTDATNDIDIAAGTATDNTDGSVMVLTSALTKQLDAAWAVGSAAGGLFSGSIANTTYAVCLILRTDTLVTDAGFDTSATCANKPAAYTKYRRIGYIVRTGATIIGFIQVGNRFDLKVPISSIDTTNPGTSAVSATLVNVPAAANLEARIGVGINTGAGGGVSMLFTALDTTDTVPSNTVLNMRLTASGAGGGELLVRTNSTPAIRYRTDFSDGSVVIRITTIGWVDQRGQDS